MVVFCCCICFVRTKPFYCFKTSLWHRMRRRIYQRPPTTNKALLWPENYFSGASPCTPTPRPGTPAVAVALCVFFLIRQLEYRVYHFVTILTRFVSFYFYSFVVQNFIAHMIEVLLSHDANFHPDMTKVLKHKVKQELKQRREHSNMCLQAIFQRYCGHQSCRCRHCFF